MGGQPNITVPRTFVRPDRFIDYQNERCLGNTCTNNRCTIDPTRNAAYETKRASLFNTTVRTDNRPEVSHSDVEWRAVQQQWAAVKATDLPAHSPRPQDLSECKVPEEVVESARANVKNTENPDFFDHYIQLGEWLHLTMTKKKVQFQDKKKHSPQIRFRLFVVSIWIKRK